MGPQLDLDHGVPGRVGRGEKGHLDGRDDEVPEEVREQQEQTVDPQPSPELDGG